MDEPIFLVIDVGSSSVRALLFDQQARLLPEGITRYAYTFSEDATVDAQALREHVEGCMDAVLARYPHVRIASVGMATFAGNMLGVSAENQPLTPLYTYADTQSRASANLLAQALDAQQLHALTGCRIHTAYHPTKLHWLQQAQPQRFAQVARWVDFATYCYQAWFGREVACSYSLASWSGLLNRTTQQWETIWLDYLGLSESHLPALADYDATVQGLSGAYVGRWYALRDAPFYLAVGDGAAANVGSLGDSREDVPVLTIGTTAAVRQFRSSAKALPMGLWAYRLDTHRQLVGGATNEGGNVFAWARQHLQLPTQDLDTQLLALPTHRLTALPLLAGERSPHFRTEAVGTLHGITLHTSGLEILHALLEGVALRLRLILDQLGEPPSFVMGGGGALQSSDAWAQILADVLSLPLHLNEDTEPTARGVVLLLLAKRGQELPPTQDKKQFYPRAETALRYAELREKQRKLYDKIYGDTL